MCPQVCHTHILFPLLALVGVILELPKEMHLVDAHSLDRCSGSQLRYMHYTAHPAGRRQGFDNIYAAAHTDMDVLSLHFRQPVAALQVALRPETGTSSNDEIWKWVKPRKEAVLVNSGDALESLSGGYLRAARHRVHRPPESQAHLDRVGVLYFSR